MTKSFFQYHNGQLFCEDVSLSDLASRFQTPLYVYSLATLKKNCQAVIDGFGKYPTLACFASKSNSNIHFLRQIVNFGFGCDVVSVGEIERALLAGCPPEKIVYSGVGKRDDEIERALNLGIFSFNAESFFELEDIARIAEKLSKTARVSLRLNPNVDAGTNPKISTGLYSTKFGMAEDKLSAALEYIRTQPQIKLVGLACHIGSQITSLDPLQKAAERIASIARDVMHQGFTLEFLDLGGGLGIRYQDETPPTIAQYAEVLINAVAPTKLKLVIEPGRVIAGETGIVLTKVIGCKTQNDKTFVIVDAAMNDLIRPALYDAFHDIVPCHKPEKSVRFVSEVVGPICETGDLLGENRQLPFLKKGDLLAILGAGAYGATMASNYNSRRRSAEVLVDGSKVQVITRRQKLSDLWALELDEL